MKHLLISLLLCSQFFLSQGQNAYLPIFSDSDTTQWIIINNGIGERQAYSLSITNDTLINGVQYFKSKQQLKNSSFDAFNGFVREDSLNKQVFFYEKDSTGAILLDTESVIYDFNLAIGDTIRVRNVDPFYLELAYWDLVLDSIKPSFLDVFQFTEHENQNGVFDGDSARVFFFSYVDTFPPVASSDDEVVWVEGLGSLDGILSPATNFFFYAELGCIHKADELYYQSGSWYFGDTCSLDAVSIPHDLESQYSIRLGQDREKESLILYFDPAPTEKLQFEILDLNGRTLHTQVLDRLRSEMEISIHSYPPGTYICRLYSASSFYHKIFTK